MKFNTNKKQIIRILLKIYALNQDNSFNGILNHSKIITYEMDKDRNTYINLYTLNGPRQQISIETGHKRVERFTAAETKFNQKFNCNLQFVNRKNILNI